MYSNLFKNKTAKFNGLERAVGPIPSRLTKLLMRIKKRGAVHRVRRVHLLALDMKRDGFIA